jgi:two-component system response regulator (stage 0 sporulation protein F)
MGEKILVVDDEPAFCEVLREFLESKGFKVTVANSGDEALTTYPEEKPSVVLMDVRMPGKDGITTLRELKGIDPGVKAVMVSAVHDEDVVREAKAEGAFYIHKPINFQYLELAISTKLGKMIFTH